jgi:hypothetical protein
MLSLGLDHSDEISGSETLDDLLSDIDLYVGKKLAES